MKRRKRGWKIARKEEMRGKAKDENLEGSELKGISGDTWILSPPPPPSSIFPGPKFPGGNFEKQPWRERNFFLSFRGRKVEEEVEVGGREEGRRNSEEGKV